MRTNRTEMNNPTLDPSATRGTVDLDNPEVPVVSATEAKQAGTGRPILAVLIGGIALAAIVWAGVEFYGSQLPGNNTGPEATVGQPSTASGDNLENTVPTTDNPNAAATRQAVPSDDGSPAAKGQGEGAPVTTNDGAMPSAGSSTNDAGSATSGGTQPNSAAP